MIRLESQYYNLNRILLLAVGLWPYQQTKFTQFQFIFFSAILSTGVTFQLTPLIILKCTSDLVAKVLSSVSFFTVFVIKYNAFHFNIEVVKNLLMELECIHNKLKDKNEIAIVYQYNCVAKRYTIALTTVGVCGISGILVQFWNIFNVDVQMNSSQPHQLLFMTKYFIDQQKYFYLILLHIYAVICVGAIVMLAVGTMLITYFQHICGIFKIASYRIEHAMSVNILQNITLKNKILMTMGIIYAVDIHRQAMKLSRHLLSTFEIMMFCLIVSGMICLSINLFQVFQIISFENININNINKLLFPIICVIITILYMFISNYIGQNIIDHNNRIFSTAYNVKWYKAPIDIQKILFLLQRKTKKFTLNVGGLFNASIECFAMLVKSSVSYFTVIYSTQ